LEAADQLLPAADVELDGAAVRHGADDLGLGDAELARELHRHGAGVLLEGVGDAAGQGVCSVAVNRRGHGAVLVGSASDDYYTPALHTISHNQDPIPRCDLQLVVVSDAGGCYDESMIVIRFPNLEAKRRALGFLPGRFSFTSWSNGEMLVPEAAL